VKLLAGVRKTGQQYNFDAIVQKLGDDYLLGTALKEPIKKNEQKYFTTTPVDLEINGSGWAFSSVVPQLLAKMTAGFLRL